MNSELRRDLTAEDGPLAGAVITDVSPVGGGCIHQAWKLRLRDGKVLFAKSGGASALPLFEVEAENWLGGFEHQPRYSLRRV